MLPSAKEALGKNYIPLMASTIMIAAGILSPESARADSISPNINSSGKQYSSDSLNSSYFGKGTGGRLSEASHLRFKGDHHLSLGQYDEAIAALSKAVQLDSGYPEGHLLLARAMTAKLRSMRDGFDWELYEHCIDEWRMLSRHAADFGEQLEARSNMSMLKKLAKAHALASKQSENGMQNESQENKTENRKTRLSGKGLFGIFR